MTKIRRLILMVSLAVSLMIVYQVSAQQSLLAEISIDSAITIAWSPDGTLLAVGGNSGGSIYTDTLQLVTDLPDFTGLVNSLTWSPDGTHLAAIDVHNGLTPIWQRDADTNTFTLSTTLQDNTNPDAANEVAWSPDGEKLARLALQFDPAGVIGNVQIWDTSTWTIETVLVDQYWTPSGFLVWSPDSQFIVGGGTGACINETPTCSTNGSIIFIADVNTGVRVSAIHVPIEPNFLSWSAINRLASDGLGSIGVYDAMTGLRLNSFDRLTNISSLDWYVDGNILIIGSDEGTIEILDTATGLNLDSFSTVSELDELRLNPSGDRLAVSTDDGVIQIWDVSYIADLVVIPTPHP